MTSSDDVLQQAAEAVFVEKERQAVAARNRLIADIAGVPYDVAAQLGRPCTVEDVIAQTG